jgi:hypothetical protein
MRRIAARTGACTAIAATTLVFTAAAATASPVPSTIWRPVITTVTKASSGYVEVAASGPRSVWALGFTGMISYLRRWNGKGWRQQSLPTRFEGYAVSASSPDDVWVLGNRLEGGGNEVGQAIFWNGRRWLVALKSVDGATVIAVSPVDVWVQTLNGLLLHWDGAVWTRYRFSYDMCGCAELVTAVGHQIWRVEADGPRGHGDHLVIRAWAGGRWEEIASPHPVVPARSFPVISALSPRNVWVGVPKATPLSHDLLLHWNGNTWDRLVAPVPAADGTTIAAVGRDGIWVANGAALFWEGKWHYSSELNCGLVTVVPGTTSALCAATALPENTRKRTTFGVVAQAGPLP